MSTPTTTAIPSALAMQPMCFTPYAPPLACQTPAKSCSGKKGQSIPICITIPPSEMTLPDCIPVKCLSIEIEGISYSLDPSSECKLIPTPAASCETGGTVSTADPNDSATVFTPASCEATLGVKITASDGSIWTYDGSKYVSDSCIGATFDMADPNTTGAVFTPPECAKVPGTVLTGTDGSTWVWDAAGNLYNTTMFQKQASSSSKNKQQHHSQSTGLKRLPTQTAGPAYSTLSADAKNSKTRSHHVNSNPSMVTRSMSGQRLKTSPTSHQTTTSPVYRFKY